jgi:hypothetical protein
MNNPVITINQQQAQDAGIDTDRTANAGPRANVTGMKKQFWGKNAFIVRIGAYIYNVTEREYRAAHVQKFGE